MMEFGKSSEHSQHSASEASADSGSLANSDLAVTPTKRERRKSPATSSDNTSTSVQPPMSPTSSVADTTFEPTIDMMVNDFDDEATLNEEEALADMEAHSAEDEIATLREESEMPIEELLAKYGGSAPSPAVSSSNRSGSSSRRARRATKRQYQELDTEMAHTSTSTSSNASQLEKHDSLEQEEPKELPDKLASPIETAEVSSMDTEEAPPSEGSKKQHRSHLLDLYPDESFTDMTPTCGGEETERFTPLQTLFDEVEAEEEEESESEMDDARKIIMVGHDYQAEIPEGLSQYGDILPYENEDQLIWEPSQVSEREVEEYLAKIQETRSIVPPEGGADAAAGEEAAVTGANAETPAPTPAPTTPPKAPPTSSAVGDQEVVVKDNEQALHLLVQCGYDFKEALRRKRMNVLPLTDTMSSWSEDECLKFEEGIQRFGKDFYQIRQNQVRTRTMRELVQFYYLWKKSERRDQSFALNDTIDHMDVFINEAGAGNGSGNGNGAGTGAGTANSNGSLSPHSSNGHSNGDLSALERDPVACPRKPASKSYSIMTGSQAAGNTPGGSRKRGTSASVPLEDEDNNVEEEPNVATV
ncbi:mesoderm induction early response protein 1 [Drosophila subpulchrella]|uniref:mesoderm induction early response protein 1 n=1 Tax=Drosophila subpulchrella TaxID=1486046 RepID=UPI0018A172B2|nr:mesoderm induction early response protein 1 [Drosophila subpulchrella]